MALKNPLLISVLLLVLHSPFSRGESTLLVPSQPLVVPVGSDVTLPCQLDPVKDIKDLLLEWSRPDLTPPYVHILRDGLDLLIEQNSLYLGRTGLRERGLQVGDMSLQLSRARLSDGGTYRCFIPQMDTGAEVTLTVVSVSPVSVSLNKGRSGSPELRCQSRGWYPEPELVWLDSEGTVLTGERTEVQRGASDETFTVSSRLSVEHSPGNTFTCRVRHQDSRQSRESHISITDEFLEVCSCSVAWSLFSLSFLFNIAAAVAFIVWKIKPLNRKKSENKDIEVGEKDEKEKMMKPEEMTKTVKSEVNEQSLELKSSENNENLQKIQDDLSFVQDVINKLTETKEFLPKLREKPQEVIKQLESQIDVEKKRSMGIIHKDKKIKEQEELIKSLEKQKEECEEIVQRLDKETKTLENVIMEAAQRKGRLEHQLKNEEKQMLKEQKRPETAFGPDPLKATEEVKVTVPVAKVQALNQTQGAQAQDQDQERQTEQDDLDDVDEFTRTMND